MLIKSNEDRNSISLKAVKKNYDPFVCESLGASEKADAHRCFFEIAEFCKLPEKSDSATPSPQERHFTNPHLSTGFEALEIDAGGHRLTAIVAAVPRHVMVANLLHVGHKYPHFLAQ